MADVLAILDAAAESNAASNSTMGSDKSDADLVFGDDGKVEEMMREMLVVNGISTLPNKNSGKVLLRAGLGTSQRPSSPSYCPGVETKEAPTVAVARVADDVVCGTRRNMTG